MLILHTGLITKLCLNGQEIELDEPIPVMAGDEIELPSGLSLSPPVEMLLSAQEVDLFSGLFEDEEWPNVVE